MVYVGAAFAIVFIAAFCFWLAPFFAEVQFIGWRLLGYPVRREGFARFYIYFSYAIGVLMITGIIVGLVLR
jgi:ABC-type antimicrobial peptide transport system permease subunit